MGMTEQQLYAEQMSHWFKEHDLLRQQLKRTILHYEQMAQSNREQLKLHVERVEMARVEYNEWAMKNGLPIRD
jgi:hypothetical protein